MRKPGVTTQSRPVAQPAGAYVITRRVRVALVGEFSAGKSTLFNSLGGRKISAVGAVPTTTKSAVLLAPGPAYGVPSGTRYRGHGPLLDMGAALIDTPGLNAEDPAHRRAAEAVAQESDIVLGLLRASDVSHRTVLEGLQRLRQGGSTREVAVVVTHVDPDDFEDEDDEADFKAELKSNIGAGPCFLVDARDLHRLDGPLLGRWLEEHVTGRARQRLLEELRLPLHALWVAQLQGGASIPPALGSVDAAAQLKEQATWLATRRSEAETAREQARANLSDPAAPWELPVAARPCLVNRRLDLNLVGETARGLQTVLDGTWIGGLPLARAGLRTACRNGTGDGKRLHCLSFTDLCQKVRERATAMPVKADLVLLLRDPKAELDAPWSALQLDATGRATDADWPWLARIAAERWTGNAVLLVDPTRMDADDGPVLLHWLTQQAAALVRRQLVPEVQTNSGHWLRRWLAEGDQGWRVAVPRVLQPDDGSFLDELERTRDAAARRRDEAPSRLRQRTRSAFDKALEVAIRADRETQEKVAHGPRDKLRLAGRAASRIAGRAARNSAVIMLLGWATLLLIQLAGPTIPRTPAVGDATMALIGALSVLWLLAFHGTTLRWRLPWLAGRAARWVGLRIWWARWRLGTPPATWREYVQSTIEARYLEECGLPAGVWIHPPALPSRWAWLGAQAPVWLPDLSQRMKAVEGRRGVIVTVLVLVGWSGWMTEQHPELLQRLGVRFSHQFHSEGPNNEAAELLELGRTRIAAQDGPGAAAALTTCLQLEPTHAGCLWELGWARWLEKDYAGTVTAWEALEAAGTWPSEELDRWIKTARIRAASQADPNR